MDLTKKTQESASQLGGIKHGMDFFDTNDFFIDEKLKMFKVENTYDVYNGSGKKIGVIQQRLSGFHKVLSFIEGVNKMLPFTFDIIDTNGTIHAAVKKGWTIMQSKIDVVDGNGKLIGKLHQQFRFLGIRFAVLGPSGQTLATLNSKGLRAKKFIILDTQGNNIGKVDKKLSKSFSEIFTSVDKYNVNFNSNYASRDNKVVILAAAVSLDLLLRN